MTLSFSASLSVPQRCATSCWSMWSSGSSICRLTDLVDEDSKHDSTFGDLTHSFLRVGQRWDRMALASEKGLVGLSCLYRNCEGRQCEVEYIV